MKAELLQHGTKTFAVVFDKGDEAVAGLVDFARENNLAAARLTAIGAFSDVTLGYFDRQRKEYRHIPVNEQVEVLSLVGDITLDKDGAPKLHAHVVVGLPDGATRGGHLLEAHVWPTLEVIVDETPAHLQRTLDPESGLALINLPRQGRE